MHFVTSGNPFKGFVTNATIGLNGVWTFAKPIVSPNIVSVTAELLTAQQDITEMDLQNIENQQALTEMELNIIERGQLL